MGCGTSTQKNNVEKTLTLPQHDSDELRAARAEQVRKDKQLYALIQHPNRDLPTWLKSLPVKTEVTASGAFEMTHIFYRLIGEKISRRVEMCKERIMNNKKVSEPFGRFFAVFEDEEIPKLASVWRSDEEFGYSRLNGLMPQFVKRVDVIPDNFKVTDKQVEGLLPRGKTLATMTKEGRLFLSDVCAPLTGVKPLRDNVMCVPMALYIVNDDAKFMPIAITLSREGGAVFTPNDPAGLWLAAKTHLSCAEFQIHWMQVHLLSEHFVMESFWACMCQAMSPRHPVHAFMAPHMWNMVFVNEGVRDSVLEDKDLLGTTGALQDNLQAGKEGCTQILKTCYAQLRWDEYFDIPVLYKKLGIMDIPNYHFRDDSLALWDIVKSYVTELLVAIYPGGAKDIAADYELQEFIKIALDPAIGDIRGLPLPSNKMETVEHLALLLTMVIYQCAVRHSHVANASPQYIPWVPSYPASFKLPIPTTHDDIPLAVLDEALPDNSETITQIALVESVAIEPSEVRPLLGFGKDFLQHAPIGCREANSRFVKRLGDLEVQMQRVLEQRKKESPVLCDFLQPSRLGASIIN